MLLTYHFQVRAGLLTRLRAFLSIFKAIALLHARAASIGFTRHLTLV